MATSAHNKCALHSSARDEEPLIDARINGCGWQISVIRNMREFARVNSIWRVWDGNVCTIIDINWGQQKAATIKLTVSCHHAKSCQ